MTVRITCPPSGALPTSRADSVVWARHRLLGGTRARAWGAYALGGDVFAWTIRHGSGCDPRLDVDGLAGAELATVVLDPGVDYTSEDVAEALALELIAEFGHDVDVDSTTVDGVTRYRVTVTGASLGVVGPPASAAGPGRVCGIHEPRRDGMGAIAGTLFVHTRIRALLRDGSEAPDGTPVRITGVGYYGDGGVRPRLAAGLGAYSNPPVATNVVDAGRPEVGEGATDPILPVVLPLPIAIPCVVGDTAWCIAKDSSGDVPYRLNSSTGYFGDCVDAGGSPQQLLVDAGSNDATAAFATTLAPGSVGAFDATSLLFVVVELDLEGDGTGFAGDGSIYVPHGCQRDAVGESPTEDEPTGEVFHYRFMRPPMSRVAVTGVAYALPVVDAASDMSAAVYAWDDLDATPSPAPRLLGQSGLLGFDAAVADEFAIGTFAAISIGADEGAEPYVSVGYTGGLITGGAPVLQIAFDTMGGDPGDFGPDGERLYNQGQSPDRQPSDYVVGGLRDVCEFVSFATSTMPYDAPAASWPSTYDLAGTDLRPGNLGREYHVIADLSATADRFTVATTADSTTAELDVGLELQAAATSQVIATASLSIGLSLTASAAVQVSASASLSVALRVRVSSPGVVGSIPPDQLTGETAMSTIDLLTPAGSTLAMADLPTPIAAASAATAVPITPELAAGSTVRTLAVGGFIQSDTDTVLTFYSGDPGADGVSLGSTPVTAGAPLYLGPWLRTRAGERVYVDRDDAAVLSGSIDTATISVWAAPAR